MSIEVEYSGIATVELKNAGQRDEYLEIVRSDGWTFAGIKVRNCFRGRVGGSEEHRNLSYLLAPGAELKWWGAIGRPVHQVEVRVEGQWVTVWDCNNDFRTQAEEDAAGNAYAQFIQNEGLIIANKIDQGFEPSEVSDQMDEGHSGNTAAWAWRLGCDGAKNQESAERFREWWNTRYDPDRPHAKGTLVNPAVITVSAKP